MWVEILEGGEIKLDEGNGKIHTKISPSGLLISVSIHEITLLKIEQFVLKQQRTVPIVNEI